MKIPVPLKVLLIIQLTHIIEDAKMIYGYKMALLLLFTYAIFDIILPLIKKEFENSKNFKTGGEYIKDVVRRIGGSIGVWAVEEYIMFYLWLVDTINWVAWKLPFGKRYVIAPANNPNYVIDGTGFRHVRYSLFSSNGNEVEGFFDSYAYHNMLTESDARYFRKKVFGNGPYAVNHWSINDVYGFIVSLLMNYLNKKGISFSSTLLFMSPFGLDSLSYSYNGNFEDVSVSTFISRSLSVLFSIDTIANIFLSVWRLIQKIYVFIVEIYDFIRDVVIRTIDTIIEVSQKTIEEVSNTFANILTLGSSGNAGGPVVGSSTPPFNF